MGPNKHTTAFLVILFLCTTASLSTAQTDAPPPGDDEPLMEQLRDLFKNEFLELGTLVQTGLRYQDPGPTGFSLSTARLKMQGVLDNGFGYKLQTDFSQSVALKDALLSYQVSSDLGFTGGRYKAPFSFEELTSSSETPFINRSRVVNALAPGRQVGTNVTASLGSTVDTHIGLYNGGGVNLGNNNNRFLYVGRVESSSENDIRALVVGANAAYNDRPGSFSETLLGADIHIEHNALLIGAEAIYGRQETPAATVSPFGHYLTVGYTLADTDMFNQLLIRWDRFTPDTDLSASDDLLLGYVAAPTSAIRFEANYVLPLEDPLETHQAMVQFQVAF